MRMTGFLEVLSKRRQHKSLRHRFSGSNVQEYTIQPHWKLSYCISTHVKQRHSWRTISLRVKLLELYFTMNPSLFWVTQGHREKSFGSFYSILMGIVGPAKGWRPIYSRVNPASCPEQLGQAGILQVALNTFSE